MLKNDTTYKYFATSTCSRLASWLGKPTYTRSTSSIATSEAFSRPRFYSPHFSISSFPSFLVLPLPLQRTTLLLFADVTQSLSWPLPLCIKKKELHTPGNGLLLMNIGHKNAALGPPLVYTSMQQHMNMFQCQRTGWAIYEEEETHMQNCNTPPPPPPTPTHTHPNTHIIICTLQHVMML